MASLASQTPLAAGPVRQSRRCAQTLAFAVQDEQGSQRLPEEAGWVFIAGSTEWKLSEAAASVMQRSWAARKHIHVDRVNSQRRYCHFWYLAERLDTSASSGQALDIVSCDGTAARFQPSQAIRRLTVELAEPSPLPR